MFNDLQPAFYYVLLCRRKAVSITSSDSDNRAKFMAIDG